MIIDTFGRKIFNQGFDLLSNNKGKLFNHDGRQDSEIVILVAETLLENDREKALDFVEKALILFIC